MEELFTVVLIIALIFIFVRLSQMHQRISNLEAKLIYGPKFEAAAAAEQTPRTIVDLAEPGVAAEKPADTSIATPKPESIPVQEPVTRPKFDFEKQFGARMPVWIGGVALALAGFFLVRYSIEQGLLDERARVVLGLLFGVALLGAGTWVRQRRPADGERIAQTLSGAGIADLYAALFVATTLYHLIPPAAGFAGMAVVTALAVVLSLRHGAPIAVLGLIGGFLTPALVDTTEPNVPLLFGYLYCVLAGLLAVIRSKGWWLLAIPTVVAAFLWVVLWLVEPTGSYDAIWPSLFLIALSATVAFAEPKPVADATLSETLKSGGLSYIALGGSIVLSGAIAGLTGFDMVQWLMFGLLAAGGIALAVFRPQLYAFVPWIAVLATAVMLLAWNLRAPDPAAFAITLIAFAVLYAGSGYAFMRRSPIPLIWGGLLSATLLGYYLLAYTTLQDSLHKAFSGVPVWGGLAMLLALASGEIVRQVFVKVPREAAFKQHLLAMFCLVTTALISIGLTIELKREFLSVAVAAEILAVAWIATRVEIPSLRQIAILLMLAFGALLLPQIVLLAALAVFSLFGISLDIGGYVPLVNWPFFQLGLPAVMLVGASWYLRQRQDDKFVQVLELAVIGLLAVMSYYVTRHLFHPQQNVLFATADFFERGINTNVIFLCGLAGLWIGQRFGRSAVLYGGMTLAGVALFRIGYFDMLIGNPLWSHEFVGNLPLLNALLLPFAVPIVWIFVLAKNMETAGRLRLVPWLHGIIIILSFVLVSLNVRQMTWGAYLDSGKVADVESYAYSIAWLLMGLVLIFAGTRRKDQLVRIASLVVMLVTVGKVFLYDASELEGLYRVFSFFALGVALIGLSWFYTRFVFATGRNAPSASST